MSAFADGLGTRIHEYRLAHPATQRRYCEKLVDGRAKHDHDE
jgi:hypothetical protein